MHTITSKDGTTIAFDKAGEGAPLILVGGMFEQRAMDSETSKLAVFPALTQHFTVYHYDRRGRGDSTDTLPFAVSREIEDIEALIDHAGGAAYLFGISSGGALAFEAASVLGGKVKKLAIYDPPYNDDAGAREGWKYFTAQVNQAIAENRRADAVGAFMGMLGVPPEQITEMQQFPMWPMWEGIAHTIAYDAAIIGEEAAIPVEKAARLRVPTLVMNGSESYPFMLESAKTLVETIPDAQYRVLEGQTHEATPEGLTPALVEFFSA